jgi:hypothetical protein
MAGRRSGLPGYLNFIIWRIFLLADGIISGARVECDAEQAYNLCMISSFRQRPDDGF